MISWHWMRMWAERGSRIITETSHKAWSDSFIALWVRSRRNGTFPKRGRKSQWKSLELFLSYLRVSLLLETFKLYTFQIIFHDRCAFNSLNQRRACSRMHIMEFKFPTSSGPASSKISNCSAFRIFRGFGYRIGAFSTSAANSILFSVTSKPDPSKTLLLELTCLSFVQRVFYQEEHPIYYAAFCNAGARVSGRGMSRDDL